MKGYQLLPYIVILFITANVVNTNAATPNESTSNMVEITESVPISTYAETTQDDYREVTIAPTSKPLQTFTGTFEEKHTYGDDDFYLNIKSADNSKLTFASKNTNVVTVSETGQVSIVGAGSTYITVTTEENENYQAGKTKIKIKIYRKSIKHLKLVIPKFGDIFEVDFFGFGGNGKGNSGMKENGEYDWDALYNRLLFFDGDKCLEMGKDYDSEGGAYISLFRSYVNIEGINNYKGSKQFDIGSIYAPQMSCLNPTNNGINVAWYGSDFSLGYIVYRKTRNGKYKEIAKIDNGKIQTYFDSDKKVNGKFYTYKVKVITKNRKKYLYKTSKNTITLQYLTPPSKLKLHQKSNGQVYATWQGNKKADGYEVCCLENKNDNKNHAFKYSFDGKNTKKGDLILLQKGKTYYVYVRAYTKNKNWKYYSDWSKGKKIKVK